MIKSKGRSHKRSTIINPVFCDGYAMGWRFPVPEAFKDALDIKFTTRVVNGKSMFVLTQGKSYSFSAYDTIYDTPKAYKIWEEALKEFKYCIVIQEAIPACHIEPKRVKTEKLINYGYVKFKLLTPDKTKEKLVLYDIYETDQEGFVCFLQTGKLNADNNKIIEFENYGGSPQWKSRMQESLH